MAARGLPPRRPEHPSAAPRGSREVTTAKLSKLHVTAFPHRKCSPKGEESRVCYSSCRFGSRRNFLIVVMVFHEVSYRRSWSEDGPS
ncbi:hypothetical protein EYF80_061196 [Liparis tanakae]|uniref:Uncharacterized protein n=1 Tax=Liparis tanakae TaxID=230148 RepID=A0A4Z2EIH5_9TELE|nr:hypothetical protein EYF80_061196 [Liparis tanakae]